MSYGLFLREFRRNKNEPTRRYCVYIPSGVEDDAVGLPVLYLLHGVGDHESSWVSEDKGQLRQMLDDLLLTGLSKPLMVVMPFGFLDDLQCYYRVYPEGAEFDTYLVDMIMPQVQQEYGARIANERDSRAIAGASMGGRQALEVGLRHPELFCAIGNFSGALHDASAQQYPGVLRGSRQLLNAAHLKEAYPKLVELVEDRLTLLYSCCGDQDGLMGVNQTLANELGELGISKAVFEGIPGGHDWGVWQQGLRSFLVRLAAAGWGAHLAPLAAPRVAGDE